MSRPWGDRGRPLRFLGAVAVGWIGLRVAMLLPEPEPPASIAPRHPAAVSRMSPLRPSTPVAAMAARIDASRGAGDTMEAGGDGAVGLGLNGHTRSTLQSHPPPRGHAERASASDGPHRPAGQGASWMPDHGQHDGAQEGRAVRPGPADRDARHVGDDERTGPPERAPAGRRRWSVSAWTVARAGIAQGRAPTGGQLGGSQAGVRLVRRIDSRGRVALAGRVTTPLGQGLREASVGLEWQPTRLPVKLVAEERLALGPGQGGAGVAIIGGFGPSPLTQHLRAEAYGQAGAIRRARIEPYVDGAVRVTHGVVRLGRIEVDLGAGAWGGAQRGAARFDLGPGLTLAMPVHRAALRLTLDWRERVAGRARPGAGPALTLGTDF